MIFEMNMSDDDEIEIKKLMSWEWLIFEDGEEDDTGLMGLVFFISWYFIIFFFF